MSFYLSHLPNRSQKPRDSGLTIALDSGYSTRQAEDFCQVASGYVDIVKLGWGTAYVTPNLDEKLSVYENYNIPVYFGGTLFEAYVLRNQLNKYVDILHKHNIRYVEVSDGTIRLSEDKKLQIISSLSNEFRVFSEVGSKNPNSIIPPYKWVKMINNELEAGAEKVICEARESGTVGVFRPNGEIRAGLIDEITNQISIKNLIFEAPTKDQQTWFIKKFGTNVNLGNIKPQSVIPLETLRLGLRSDTLFDFYSLDEELNTKFVTAPLATKPSQEKSSNR